MGVSEDTDNGAELYTLCPLRNLLVHCGKRFEMSWFLFSFRPFRALDQLLLILNDGLHPSLGYSALSVLFVQIRHSPQVASPLCAPL